MISVFFENFNMALSSVLSNKTRSLLTALGIIIGVFSVTLMGTLISGLDRSFEGSMSMLGRDILYISRFEWFGDCLLYTSPSPRDRTRSRMPSSA